MSLKPFIFFVLFFCASFLSIQALTLHESGYWHGVKDYPISPSREALIKEAKNAMHFIKTQDMSNKKRPGGVSALWTPDGKLHIASSLKGGKNVHVLADKALGIDKRISHKRISHNFKDCAQSLNQPDAHHFYHGRCAEVMVVQEWYRKHNHDQAVNLPKSGKLIATVNGKLEVQSPCSNQYRIAQKSVIKDSLFGCSDFLTKAGFGHHEIVTTDPDAGQGSCQRHSLTSGACHFIALTKAPQNERSKPAQHLR